MHYFILVAGKNHAQLLEVDGDAVSPRVVEGMPTSIDEAWTGTERQEKSLQFHSTGGGTAAFHGQGGAKDAREQEEDVYMHKLAKSVHALVHGTHLPLVFAGVEEAYGMFKKFDQSGALVDEYVRGSVERLSGEELKEKADPIARAHIMKRNEALIEEYGALLGTGRTSTDKYAIMSSATNGKVDLLLIAEGHEDEAADLVKHVIEHRGRVALIADGKIPENATIAAILRL